MNEGRKGDHADGRCWVQKCRFASMIRWAATVVRINCHLFLLLDYALYPLNITLYLSDVNYPPCCVGHASESSLKRMAFKFLTIPVAV
jgi:hypothetical protein